MFTFFLLLLTVSADFESDRKINIYKWIFRTRGSVDMRIAYSPDVVDFEKIKHSVRYAGSWGPGYELAFEYDRLTTDAEMLPQLGMNPVVFIVHPESIYITKKDVDIYQVDYSQDIKMGADYVNKTYKYYEKDFQYTEIVIFNNNSTIINHGYSISDPDADRLHDAVGEDIDNLSLCGIIFAACDVTNSSGYNYIRDTGFNSFYECLTFMNSLPEHSNCPYVYQSNTTQCRNLHAFSSLFLPQVHCDHVKPDSHKCMDSCTGVCSQCHSNAECVPTYPDLETVVYQCVCKNGHIGNGTNCIPKTCSYNICPALYGSYNCSTGLCMCKNGFLHNPKPSEDICYCPETSQVIYDNNGPYCVPKGHCLKDKWNCRPVHNENSISCQKPRNQFSQYSTCICNYGYVGGWINPCLCESPKREVWSSSHSGTICITPQECSEQWHCTYPKQCLIVNGTIGKCV